MASEDAEKTPPTQDELEEIVSATHKLLFEQVRKGDLDWISQGPNSTTQGSPDEYAKKKDGFRTAYKDSFHGGKQDDTIFHTFVDDRDNLKDVQKYKPLLKLVLELGGDILGTDDEGRTPLHNAIRARKAPMVQLLCQIAPSPSALIKKKCGQDNCLHLAIKRWLAFKPAMEVLIENSDDDALREGDEHGNTPLHLAVDRQFFGLTAQDSLVKKLAEKCPDALKILNKEDNPLSPFLYLNDSHRKFRESRSADPKQVEQKAAEAKSAVDSRSMKGAPPRQTPSTMTTALEKALGRVKSFTPEPNVKATRSPARPEQTRKKNRHQPDLSEDQVVGIFKKITADLKRFILRKFPRDEALKMLYGPISGDHNIDFNLLTANRRLTPKMIAENYKFLKFEKILQYVALPNLLPDVPSPSQTQVTPGKEQKRKIGEGKSDGAQEPIHYKQIFDWLRKIGVQEIFRIIVEDDVDNPHSDEVIENTIKGFGVEVWDWKKYDICSETILKAAPGVKEVYLYSTGNNAVLRGWSDQGGLRRLTKLEKVVLFVKGLQSSQRTKRDIEQFKTRLQEQIEQDNKGFNRTELEQLLLKQPGTLIRFDEVQKLPLVNVGTPNKRHITIEVVSGDPSEEHRVSRMPKKRTSDEQKAHRWLDCVFRCSQWIRNSGALNPKPVKVALIDDGVDANHLHLRENIKGGVTYCTSSRVKRNVTNSYYASSTGHGTLMAALICFVCPDVQLYVAKLDDQQASDGSFTARSAADAVRWAISMQVDIISMSWTIEKAEKANALNDLDTALSEAGGKDILMFCAARDEGLENPKRRPFPAASGTNKIMIIGAAGPSGAISTWVNAGAIHFLFPGIELREARPELMPPEMVTVDGSSTATALASGLAALLLTILATDTSNTWNPKHGRYDKINNILTSIQGDKKYVQIWDLFDEYTRDSQTEGDRKVLQKMVDGILFKAK